VSAKYKLSIVVRHVNDKGAQTEKKTGFDYVTCDCYNAFTVD